MHKTPVLRTRYQRISTFLDRAFLAAAASWMAFTLGVGWYYEQWGNPDIQKALCIGVPLIAVMAHNVWGHLLPKGALITVDLNKR